MRCFSVGAPLLSRLRLGIKPFIFQTMNVVSPAFSDVCTVFVLPTGLLLRRWR